MGITPFGEMNITLTDLGTNPLRSWQERIVTPGNIPENSMMGPRSHSGLQWAFPCRLRYEFPYKEMDGVDPFQSYELKGWG